MEEAMTALAVVAGTVMTLVMLNVWGSDHI
jgi:hypothetical protein